MSTKRIYEQNPEQAYATPESGQVVSRSLFAVVERGDTPLDGGFGEAELIEVAAPALAGTEDNDESPLQIRVDTVPQDTMAVSPDAAAVAAAAMQGLSNDTENHLGFRVEYQA